MRNAMIAIAAVVGTFVTPLAARAQTVGVAPSTGVVVSSPVEIESGGGIIVGQRPAFREYVVRERIPSYTIPDQVVVGSTLPDDGITYYDVPQRFGATPYRYSVVNGQTLLVEPRSRRVIQVID